VPKRSDDYMQARRREILVAAREVALYKSWPKITVDEVAAKAGLSKGAVYTHFASKRDLLAGLVELNVDQIDAVADLKTVEAFRADYREQIAMLCGPDGWEVAVSTGESQIEGVRDPELRVTINAASNRLISAFTVMINRFVPGLDPVEAERRVLTLIMLIDGMRSFRTISSALTHDSLSRVFDAQVDALLRP
jgi:AcrR family transcriptional regulator